VANLYPQYFQVVAAADAKVHSFADFKGKSLVTQPKGNTAEILTSMVRANALLIIPETRTDVLPGESLTAILLGDAGAFAGQPPV